MTLEPQKAQINEDNAEAEEEEKRARRVAPEFTLCWSDEAQKLALGLSSRLIKKIGEAAYARIELAEAALCGELNVVTITPMPEMSSFDNWWAPFCVEDDLWFVLKCEDKQVREYHLHPADGPAPDGGGDPPVMTRRQKSPPPKRAAPRARKTRGTKSARPAAAKRPPRQTETERVFILLYELVNSLARRGWHDWRHAWAQLERGITPRLTSSIGAMRRYGGNVLGAIRDCLATLVQMSRECASLALRVEASFTGAREIAVETPEASLEPRCVGQNSGFPVLVYSWVRSGPPPVDWSTNPFGLLPEEKRAFR